jgi:hypothetical protein
MARMIFRVMWNNHSFQPLTNSPTISQFNELAKYTFSWKNANTVFFYVFQVAQQIKDVEQDRIFTMFIPYIKSGRFDIVNMLLKEQHFTMSRTELITTIVKTSLISAGNNLSRNKKMQ